MATPFEADHEQLLRLVPSALHHFVLAKVADGVGLGLLLPDVVDGWLKAGGKFGILPLATFRKSF
jgi:hypothetical protein